MRKFWDRATTRSTLHFRAEAATRRNSVVVAQPASAPPSQKIRRGSERSGDGNSLEAPRPGLEIPAVQQRLVILAMSRQLRRRRPFEKTRQCGESFLGGEVELTTADVFWKIYSSLKASAEELSETLKKVSQEQRTPCEEDEPPETVQIRPYASVPRRLELYVPWKSIQPFAQEMDAQVHLASSSHVLFPSLFNFVSGFEGGVTSFAVLQLTDAHLVGSMLPLSAWDIGAVVSSRVCGALCGSTLLLCSSKETSSRDVLLWTAVGITAISLGTFFADRNTLLLLRFLAGLAEGVSSPAKAAYVVETVEAELRGASNGTRWAAFAVGSCEKEEHHRTDL
eukprot:s1179_g21.t1